MHPPQEEDTVSLVPTEPPTEGPVTSTEALAKSAPKEPTLTTAPSGKAVSVSNVHTAPSEREQVSTEPASAHAVPLVKPTTSTKQLVSSVLTTHMPKVLASANLAAPTSTPPKKVRKMSWPAADAPSQPGTPNQATPPANPPQPSTNCMVKVNPS